MTDVTVEGHDRGPLYGTDTIGFHSVCDCGVMVEGLTRNEVADAHEQHVGALALRPGVARARAALAESLERGKPVPAEVTS